MTLPPPFSLSISAQHAEDCRVTLPVPAPVSGKVEPMAQVPSALVTSGLLGAGVAISPTGHTVLAPFSGTVVSVSSTKEQIRLKSRQGLELLIQIGLNSHKMMSEGFKSPIKAGDKITQGQLLMEFDLRKLRLGCTSPLCLVLVPVLPRLKHIQGHYHSLMAGEEPCMTLFLS
ncbi:PTS sugar transporter subunit IIA [Lacimicrobium alkaliphilum]|uniref:PTS system glucose-specific EIIA component n=1 Tax=Lacimicrobium alkaliphilum TaxID=1526571 RepID=A0ABQ1R0I1_9ALTE|nr:PTS glucose transporter subunit IIA [Lacimicrobium alkaliphilum]GGD53823.1 hypothetical protein GCM10011357_07000 [Lacimicrobium alkaliphilum]